MHTTPSSTTECCAGLRPVHSIALAERVHGLFLVHSELCLRGFAGALLKLEISKWPFAGVSRCRCTSNCGSVLRIRMLGMALLAPKRVALPCRPVAVCKKGLLGDEQAAHFPLENGVLEWKMAQSGASGGAAQAAEAISVKCPT